MSEAAIFEAHRLEKVYSMGETKVHALRGVNLRAQRGDFVALMGPSGSGKSTLLYLLGCLDVPTVGTYRLEGSEISSLNSAERAYLRNKRIGFIFQTFNLLPQLSVLDNVALPLMYQRKDIDEIARGAAEVLEQVGLGDRLHHHPAELSGGQQQRVAIARALVTDPILILADEPTGNLDRNTGDTIMRLLVELSLAGRTIVLVTHDRHMAAYAKRILYLLDGKICSSVSL